MTDVGKTTTEKIIPGLLLMMIINTYEYVSLSSSKTTSKKISVTRKNISQIFLSFFKYLIFFFSPFSRCRFPKINIFHINNFCNPSNNYRKYYLHLGDKKILDELGTNQ
jgi:hypothetical protein